MRNLFELLKRYLFSIIIIIKVGPESEIGKVHCLCDHLTSFSGEFFFHQIQLTSEKSGQSLVGWERLKTMLCLQLFALCLEFISLVCSLLDVSTTKTRSTYLLEPQHRLLA